VNKPRVVIIGIGNEFGGDDAVGLVVARKLKRSTLDRVAICEENGEGTALIELWRSADLAILIDAAYSGADPGKIYRFEAHVRPIPTEFFRRSTHAFGVPEAIELARTLKRLPKRIVVYGIEGERFGAAIGLSRAVETAAQEVVNRVLRDCEKASRSETRTEGHTLNPQSEKTWVRCLSVLTWGLTKTSL